MNAGQAPAPAGWYPDPEGGEGRSRYWDGSHWTDRYAESGSVTPAGGDPAKSPAKQRGFGSLELIAGIFFVLGWLTIILGSITVIAVAIDAAGDSSDAFSAGDEPEPAAVVVVGAIAIAIYALMFFAASAFIRLMLAIEDNTRRTAAGVARLEAR